MNKKLGLISTIILGGALFRLLPHPPNATPIGAMALAGGLYIGRKYLAFIIPILALIISDIIINNTISRSFFPNETGFILLSKYMIFTYLAFALTVCIGFALMKSSRMTKIIGGTLFTSILFFVLTNFGTWLTGPLYTKDFAGLMTCFAAAIPFFFNTLIGNFIFVGLFVLVIEFIIKTDTQNKLQEVNI